jgi:hypothetical protein
MTDVAELETAGLPGSTGITGLFIEVVTGDVDHAGTDAKVTFRVDQDGFLFYDQGHDAQERGSTDIYGYPVSYTLEQLRGAELVLSHDNSGDYPGWYVERVLVQVRVPGSGDIDFKAWNKVGWLASDEPNGCAVVLQRRCCC